MPGQLLFEYLDRRNASYVLQPHQVAYTAPEIAELSHFAGNAFAKVVMVTVDGELSMVVIPAHYRVDLEELEIALRVDCIELSTEREFCYRFPRCEIGAMPPFGHLYGLNTYMISVFEHRRTIAFNAGNHSEIVRMPMSEYLRLAYVTEVEVGAIPPSVIFNQYRQAAYG